MIMNTRIYSKGTELQIIVTVQSGATVTATKGSLSVSGTSVNGTCTLVVPEEGEWMVSATLGGETSVPKTVTITPTTRTELAFLDPILNNNTWEKIKQISDNGTAANYWSIGDRKEVTLDGTVGHLTLSNYVTYAFIIGFNHNQELEGNNRIHFQLAKTALSGGTDVAFCDSLCDTTVSTTGYFSMNSTPASSGGWESSQMRKNICGISLSSYSGTILAVIPTALRAVLKSVTKYTNNVGGTTSASAVTATTDYFFLLSEYEAFGTISRGNLNEKSKQAQYAYYSAGNSKVKYKYDNTSEGVNWWLRSPSTSASFFLLATYIDNISANYSYFSAGFAPGFCV